MLQLQDEEELLVVDAFDHVQSFVAQAKRAATLADLNTLLGEVGTSLGLDYYALAHHVDLGRPPSSSVLVSNYPIGWFHTILRQRYFVDDPIFAAAQHASAGFLWEDIGALIQLSDRQKRIFSLLPGAKESGQASPCPSHCVASRAHPVPLRSNWVGASRRG